jgi:U3 small nucleolar RNA-associated protein 20
MFAVSEPLNYGSEILLPHVTKILSYLHRRATVANSKKRKSGGLAPRELAVLSRISEMVTDPEPSLALLQLIVPLCIRKAQRGCGDGILVPLLTTLENLLRCITPPENLALQLTPMFSTVTGRQSRQILCSIMFRLVDKNEARIASDLNSWDPRRLEDPNYEKRISAFTDVTKSEEISLELGLLVIHNCYYTLKTEKDISLRDCSSHCLQTVCPQLAHKFSQDPHRRTLVMERTIMELLRRGVRDKNETVQEEILALLGVMVRKCGELHPTLRDLQVWQWSK